MDINIIRLKQTASTSDYLRQCPTPARNSMTVATAEYQTAGRGQASNSWESEAGKNLLFSILTSPQEVAARHQFVLSMAGALALKAALYPICGEVRLKWPNDIYWHNGKLSGTLIETAMRGKTIERCIYGIGINVNQTAFRSDAPNPVSIINITGRETLLDGLLDSILKEFATYYLRAIGGDHAALTEEYNRALYRNDGLPHPFEDCSTGERFDAVIKRVDSCGLLHLVDTEGKEREYTLKELKHINN